MSIPITRNHVAENIRTLLRTRMKVNITSDKLHNQVRSHLDSIEKLELIMLVEHEFRVTITNQEMEDINTFDDLIEKVCSAKAIATV